jgi:pyruvate/2-oxoacid:ferredoxin oxidoreductase beta subunit
MPENLSITAMRMAVQTNIFPLYEVENGETYRQTVTPDEVIPVDEYLQLQGRFRHFTKKEVSTYQSEIDKRYQELNEKFGKGN